MELGIAVRHRRESLFGSTWKRPTHPQDCMRIYRDYRDTKDTPSRSQNPLRLEFSSLPFHRKGHMLVRSCCFVCQR